MAVSGEMMTQDLVFLLKRKDVDDRLAAACEEAAEEDCEVNGEWESVTLETWS
jgi:hypothetical protein